MKSNTLITVACASLLAACAGSQPSSDPVAAVEKEMKAVKDGELGFPTGFEGWPVFIAAVDKEGTKQIRDIYIDTQGEPVQKGGAFPDGTQFVMAIYGAQETDAGLVKTADGKLVKGDLSKVFVMQKGTGWGAHAPTGLANGDWVYTAYNANGSKADADYTTCRGCHLPLADTDYIFHYDQYFDN